MYPMLFFREIIYNTLLQAYSIWYFTQVAVFHGTRTCCFLVNKKNQLTSGENEYIHIQLIIF